MKDRIILIIKSYLCSFYTINKNLKMKLNSLRGYLVSSILSCKCILFKLYLS